MNEFESNAIAVIDILFELNNIYYHFIHVIDSFLPYFHKVVKVGGITISFVSVEFPHTMPTS